jgi:hypothetical protein
LVAAKLPLGSGMVESACKLVVEAREKGAGMRWKRAGAQAVARLRAVQRSGDWARFWAGQPKLRRTAAPRSGMCCLTRPEPQSWGHPRVVG